MSKDSKGIGCLAVVVLVVGLFVIGAIGRFVFGTLEMLALAFTYVGVEDPVTAWIVLGALIGALIGLVVGLRRNGRRRQLPEIGLAVSALLLLAFIGAGAIEPPSPAPPPVRTPPPPTPALFSGTITAEALNVRAGPSPSQRAIARLPRGTRVEVLATPGTWIQIRFDTAESEGEGWVSRRFVRFDGEEAPSAEPEEEPEGVAPPPTPEPQPAAPRAYRPGELSSPPQFVEGFDTQRTTPGGFEGLVRVRIVVDEAGIVQEAECISNAPRPICSRAESASRKALFRPGRLDGRAVRTQTQVIIPFEPLPQE